MTKILIDKEAVEQAIEALVEVVHWNLERDQNDEPLPIHKQNPEIKDAIEAIEPLKQALEQSTKQDRHELQAKGEHPAPCARFCEANAFQIEIRNLKKQLEQSTEQEPDWKALVLNHNKDCESRCDMDICGYKPYFEHNGRRCPTCPVHEKIYVDYTQPQEAAPTEQEPVAWITQGGKGWLRWHKSYDDNKDSVPLYTQPQEATPRQWVGLTEEERLDAKIKGCSLDDYIQIVEAKLKTKNGITGEKE